LPSKLVSLQLPFRTESVVFADMSSSRSSSAPTGRPLAVSVGGSVTGCCFNLPASRSHRKRARAGGAELERPRRQVPGGAVVVVYCVVVNSAKRIISAHGLHPRPVITVWPEPGRGRAVGEARSKLARESFSSRKAAVRARRSRGTSATASRARSGRFRLMKRSRACVRKTRGQKAGVPGRLFLTR
jgi:hypothetical protein